jgi:hypothetical protein
VAVTIRWPLRTTQIRWGISFDDAEEFEPGDFCFAEFCGELGADEQHGVLAVAASELEVGLTGPLIGPPLLSNQVHTRGRSAALSRRCQAGATATSRSLFTAMSTLGP